jgi:hypothetical protein
MVSGRATFSDQLPQSEGHYLRLISFDKRPLVFNRKFLSSDCGNRLAPAAKCRLLDHGDAE